MKDHSLPRQDDPAASADAGVAAPVAEPTLEGFCCYAEEDAGRRKWLAACLAKQRVDLNGDWQLVAGPDWQEQVRQLILKSDFVVFLLSPASAASPPCRTELEEAARLNKRILPVRLRGGFDEDSLTERVRAAQWVKLDSTEWDCSALKVLLDTIRTDWPLMHMHTLLLGRAEEWQASKCDAARLLRGSLLQQATAWLPRAREGPMRFPKPTALQETFIAESETARLRRRRLTLLGGAVLASAVAMAAWRADEVRLARLAETTVGSIAALDGPTQEEAEAWLRVARADQRARLHFVEYALSTEERAERVARRLDQMVHATVGLDFSGEESPRYAAHAIATAVQSDDVQVLRSTAGFIAKLRSVRRVDARRFSAALTERMRREQDSRKLVELGEALATVASMFEEQDVQPGASALALRMKNERDSFTVMQLGVVFWRLAERARPEDVVVCVQALVEQVRAHAGSMVWPGSEHLQLKPILAGLCSRIEVKDARSLATALLERLEHDDNISVLGTSADGLVHLSGRLEQQDLHSIALVLIGRITREQNASVLEALASALAGTGKSLDCRDAQFVAAALIKRMRSEQDGDAMAALGNVLGALGRQLKARELQEGAVVLAERMKRQQGRFKVEALGRAMTSITGWLDAKQVHTLASALLQRAEREHDSYVVAALGTVLATQSEKLLASDVRRLSEALVGNVLRTQDHFARLQCVKALTAVGGRLPAEEAAPLAASLAARMVLEKAATLQWSEAIVVLSGALNAEDARKLAAPLLERLRHEQDETALMALGSVLGALSGKLEAESVQSADHILIERIKSAPTSPVVAALAQAVARLARDVREVQSVTVDLVSRMTSHPSCSAEPRMQDAARLADAVAALSVKLEMRDAQPLAGALASQIKTEWNLECLTDMARAWVALEAVGRTQIDVPSVAAYTDLLKQPLVVGKARNTLLGGLGKLTGQEFDGDVWRFVTWVTGREGAPVIADCSRLGAADGDVTSTRPPRPNRRRGRRGGGSRGGAEALLGAAC
jgi:hypothetical protein